MGEVRIGASDMTLQFFLLPYLEQFHKEYPRIKVTVTNAPTPETIRCLEAVSYTHLAIDPAWKNLTL